MRVGLVCPYDLGSPGGVQQLTEELAQQLRKQGDEVVVVGPGTDAFHGGPGSDATTVPAGRPFVVRANRSRVPLTLSPSSWWRVRRGLSGVDVVHLHEPLVPLVGWVTLMVGKPLVATFHADAPRWVRRVYRWAPLLERLLGRATLTAVSDAAAQAIPKSWGEVTIIPNAIDIASYDLPVGRVPRRVAFLGRDDPRKGLDVLLGAWPSIREACPDAELMVIGASRPDPPTGITFLGRVSSGEKKRMLASSAVYVAPNTGGESFGIAVAEGMAAGCAVVASDLAPFRSVIGDAGLTFPVGDQAALANVVIELLSNPDSASQLGTRARERVKRYDWADVASAYRDSYEKATKKAMK